jgi:glycosyltransferase involved in cell wall biosynthesis
MGEKYISSRTDLNISVSQSNQLSGKDFIPSFTSVVINNGIDQKKFNPENTITNLRSELNIGAEKILVLFIARFTSHKQPLALLRAFADAFPKNKNMHLLMVGDGDEKDDALRIVKETGLEEHVTFQPFRQDVPAVLAAADIFVLPSLWEGLPIGLLEAMAMGKAIIATNVDGTKEIIQHEQNGILVSTDGLIKNLSSAIVSLSMNGDKRALFQQNARETVKQRFDAADVTRKIEAEYEKLINKYTLEKKGSLVFK